MDAKPWYASKTIWSNALAVLGSAGLAALGTITPETAGATAALAAGNVILRAMTTQAVTACQDNTNAKPEAPHA